MGKRLTVVFSVRLDKSIVDALNQLTENSPRTRNFIIEQILGEKCGLPYYEWKIEEQDEDDR